MPQQIGVEVVAIGVAAFSRALRTAQDDLDRTASKIREVSGTSVGMGEKLLTLGDTMQRLGRSMTIGITAPLGILTGSLISAGVAFEDSFAGIAKTVDGIGVGFDEIKAAALDRLGIVVTTMDEAKDAADKMGMSFGDLTPIGEDVRKQFREMALEIPISANELNKFGETAGQFGVQADQIEGVTRSMAALEVATNLAGDAAGSQLIQLKNISKSSLDASEFINRAGSSLVYLGNSSVSTESQILDMTMRIAAAGDLANFTVPEMFAWGTTVSDMGVRAEKGGTAVSRMINEMMIAVATGSDNLGTFASVMGVSVDELKQMFEKDASGAIFTFTQRLTEGIEAGTVSKEMLTSLGLGGVRAIDVVERLSGAQDQFTNNLNMANKSWEEGIALQEEAEKRYNTVKSQIQLTKNAFTDLGITIFDLIKDDIKKLLDNIQKGIAWFKNLDAGILRTILKFAGIAAAIGPVLVVLGALASSAGAVSIFVKALPMLFGKLAKSLLATLGPVGLLIASLMTIISILSGAGFKLNIDFSGVLKEAQKTFDTIKTEIGKIGDAFANLKIGDTGFLKSLQGLLDTLIQGIVDKILFVMKFVQDMAKGFSDAFIPFITDKGPQIERILGNFKTIIDNVREAFEKVGTAIATALGLDTSGTGVGEFLGTLAGMTFEGVLDGLENISGFISDMTTSFGGLLDKLLPAKPALAGIAEMAGKFGEAAGNISKLIGNLTEAGSNEDLAGFSEAFGNIASSAKTASDSFGGVAAGLQGIMDTVSSSDTLQSLISLLKTMGTISLKNLEGAMANIKQAFDGFIEGITPFLNAQGPRFKRIMEDLGKAGTALGPLAKALEKLFKALDKLGGTVIRNLEKLLVSLGIIEEGQAAGSVGKFLGMWAGVMIDEAMKNIEYIISLIDDMINAITWVVDAGANFATWLEGLSGPSEKAGQALGGLVGQFNDLLGGGLEEKVKTGTGNILTAVGTFAQGILTGIIANIDQAFVNLLGEERWTKLQEAILVKIPAIFAILAGELNSQFDKLVAIISFACELAGKIIDEKLHQIVAAISFIWDLARQIIDEKLNQIKGVVALVWGLIWPIIKVELDKIVNFISSAWDLAKQVFEDKLNQLKASAYLIWYAIKMAVITLIDSMIKDVQGKIKQWVDGFVEVIDWLYKTLVGGSIIPDMVNKIISWFRYFRDEALKPIQWFADRVRDAMNGIQNVLNDVKYAFDLLQWKIGNVVNTAKWYLDQLGSKVQEVLSMITGSPELVIQHPFEKFESYLKAVDFSKLIEGSMALNSMNQISMVAPAGTGNQSSTTIDRRIQANISGVPLDTANGIVDILQRQTRMSEVFQQ